MFFKATVQAVLLFGSETWNLTPTAVKCLEGFQLRAAWRMAREYKPRRAIEAGTGTVTWAYPPTEKVLEECGLFPMTHYIEVRKQHVASFIVNRPIFDLCVGSERLRGTAPRQYWWEQTLDLDAARASANFVTAGEEVGPAGD